MITSADDSPQVKSKPHTLWWVFCLCVIALNTAWYYGLDTLVHRLQSSLVQPCFLHPNEWASADHQTVLMTGASVAGLSVFILLAIVLGRRYGATRFDDRQIILGALRGLSSIAVIFAALELSLMIMQRVPAWLAFGFNVVFALLVAAATAVLIFGAINIRALRGIGQARNQQIALRVGVGISALFLIGYWFFGSAALAFHFFCLHFVY